MASIASACRFSARLAGRRIVQNAAVRGFRTSAVQREAHNFMMPALSPTMTEGNIAKWNVKEGDSFATGDVLLEIETDKATMDVEAQEDGILMKIMVGDGTKGVTVGSRIGVLAEPGDDIKALEIPADEAPKQEAKKVEQPSQPPEAVPEKKAAESSPPPPASAPKPSGKKAAPQTYPLYPSIEQLMKERNIPESAVADMTPTGPKGRLLKGDVLAYLGTINAGRPAECEERFNEWAHLDLSNIKVRPPPPPPKAAAAEEEKPPVLEDLLISQTVSFAEVVRVQKKVQHTLGTFLPLSTFIARATEVANDELPLPSDYKPSADELFNQVLGLTKVSPKVSKGYYMPQITALAPVSFTRQAPAKVDIIDILAGTPLKTKTAAPREIPGISMEASTFKLKVPKSEEKRAQVFLARLKTVLEQDPGRLVL